ncbi:MAG: hypothetical protein V2A65_05840 [Candidatus Omnitrophota bacterium]
MCAKFSWQEEKPGGSKWTYDGSSSMREKPDAKIKRKVWLRRSLILAGVVLLAGVTIAGSVFRIHRRVKSSGVVEPLRYDYVRTPTSGTIELLPFEEGQYVKKDQSLAVILPDDPTFFSDIENRVFDLTGIQKECERINERIGILTVELEQLEIEQELFKKDFSEVEVGKQKIQATEAEYNQSVRSEERARKLYEQEAISQVEYDNTVTKKEVARANLAIARAQLESSQNSRYLKEQQLGKDIAAKQKEIIMENISLVQKRTESQQTSGIIKRVRGRSGRLELCALEDSQIVRREKLPGDHLETGELICLLSRGEERRILVKVTPRNAVRLKLGQRVLIYSNIFYHWKYGVGEGRIFEIGTYARTTDGQGIANYIPVKIAVEKAPFPLPFGTTVSVVLLTHE